MIARIAATAILLAAVLADPALAALPEWSPELPTGMTKTVELDGFPALVRAQASHRARRAQALRKPRPVPAPATAARKGIFVTDPQTWSRLIERGKKSQTIETVNLAGVEYRFHVLDTAVPVPGQVCAPGTVVDNTLYVYEGLPLAPGAELYPFRISAECIGQFGAPDALSIDADADGKILNVDLIKAPSTAAQHPTFDPANNSAENIRLRAFLKALVDLFLSTP